MYSVCNFDRKRHFPEERFFKGHTFSSVGNFVGVALSPGRGMDEVTTAVSLLNQRCTQTVLHRCEQLCNFFIQHLAAYSDRFWLFP